MTERSVTTPPSRSNGPTTRRRHGLSRHGRRLRLRRAGLAGRTLGARRLPVRLQGRRARASFGRPIRRACPHLRCHLPGHRAERTHHLHLRHAPRRQTDFRLARDGGVQAGRQGHAARLHRQGAFLDGFDDPRLRERGTIDLLDNLGKELTHVADGQRRGGNGNHVAETLLSPARLVSLEGADRALRERHAVRAGHRRPRRRFVTRRALPRSGRSPISGAPRRSAPTNDRRSDTIIEYLDAFHPGATQFVPSEAERTWQSRMWDRFFDHYIHEPMQKVVTDRIRPEGKGDPYGVEQAEAQSPRLTLWSTARSARGHGRWGATFAGRLRGGPCARLRGNCRAIRRDPETLRPISTASWCARPSRGCSGGRALLQVLPCRDETSARPREGIARLRIVFARKSNCNRIRPAMSIPQAFVRRDTGGPNASRGTRRRTTCCKGHVRKPKHTSEKSEGIRPAHAARCRGGNRVACRAGHSCCADGGRPICAAIGDDSVSNERIGHGHCIFRGAARSYARCDGPPHRERPPVRRRHAG